MSKIWITELRLVANDGTGLATPLAAYPGVAKQTVTISGTSAQSAAINAATTYVRLRSDVACHFAVGTNPTATTDDTPLDANAAEYIGVTPGHKIAVIAA